MAELLKNGSVKMRNGRILWGRDTLQIIDLCELTDLLCPRPAPVAGGFQGFGGGGGRGERGFQGPAGTGGGGTGSQGSQGFQGFQGSGSGSPGPQGNQGPQGFQGVQGPQGFQGLQGSGVQGPQGNQGNQGNQGFQGALNPDIFAATRVVSLIAGDGTDLTIAAAIAALPAEGGYIYIKQGIYPLAASLVPTNKPIVFLGSGDGTILSLGANVISAFTINFNQRYTFGRMRILGGGVAGQVAFEFNIGGSSTESVTMSDVTVDNMEKPFLVAGTDFPLVHTTDCFFRVANLATSRHWDGPGEWRASNTIASFTGVVPRGGFANNPDLAWVNSEVWIPGAGDVNYVQMDRCRILNGTLSVGAQGSIIGDSVFDTNAVITRFIDILAAANAVVLEGCSFGSTTSQRVRIASQNCIVDGNSGLDVEEIGTADFNRYDGNDPFFQNSVIIGDNSLVNNEGTATVAVNTLLTGYSRTIEVDASGGARTITLPPAAGVNKIVYTIKKIDASANNVTIDPDAAELIDGVATQLLTTQWQALRIQSNGTGWIII